MKTLKLTVATLYQVLLDDDVSAVYFPTSNGEVGVLTDHTTYLTNTLSGTIRYVTENNKTVTLNLTRSGIFFIQDNRARLWIC